MKVGILEVGFCNPTMEPKYGLYPPLFPNLIAASDPSIECRGYRVLEGVFPQSPGECDGWLITGSKFGVYDDLPWLPRVRAFIEECYALGAPMIGVCFGHQLLADTLGGRAEKSTKGWGTGVHRYAVRNDPAWFGVPIGELSLHAMHQDQVTATPPDARVLASSDFCPAAALAYGPPGDVRAISVQGHPEFDETFERDLILSRRGVGLPTEIADAALDSLGAPVDAAAMADWFVAFLKDAVGRRRAAA